MLLKAPLDHEHYSDIIMGVIVPQITSILIVCPTIFQVQIKENI